MAELIDAIKAGDAQRVHSLLEAGTPAAERDENGVSALMLARYHGLPEETVEAIRAAHGDPDVFEAATLGDDARLQELLDRDPDLARAWSPDRATALHFAAFFAQPSSAKLLLDRGADVAAVSPTFGDVTPLHSAAAGGSAEIVSALLDAGADANAVQQGGFTPLHAAAQSGDEAMARDLLEHGADPDAATDDGRTARTIAEEQGHEQLAALLAGSP